MCHIVNLRLAKARRGMLQQRPGAEYRPQQTVRGVPGVQQISDGPGVAVSNGLYIR